MFFYSPGTVFVVIPFLIYRTSGVCRKDEYMQASKNSSNSRKALLLLSFSLTIPYIKR